MEELKCKLIYLLFFSLRLKIMVISLSSLVSLFAWKLENWKLSFKYIANKRETTYSPQSEMTFFHDKKSMAYLQLDMLISISSGNCVSIFNLSYEFIVQENIEMQNKTWVRFFFPIKWNDYTIKRWWIVTSSSLCLKKKCDSFYFLVYIHFIETS